MDEWTGRAVCWCGGLSGCQWLCHSAHWLGAGSGSVTQRLCDAGPSPLHLWASATPSMKSLSLAESRGPGGGD